MFAEACGTLNVMSTETSSLLIDAEVHARLERVASEAGHNASALAGAVLRNFLDENDAYDAAIQAGIDDVDAGRVVSFEEFKADVALQLGALRAKG